jgi:hypothetical protein
MQLSTLHQLHAIEHIIAATNQPTNNTNAMPCHAYHLPTTTDNEQAKESVTFIHVNSVTAMSDDPY